MKTNFKSVGSAQKYSAFPLPAGYANGKCESACGLLSEWIVYMSLSIRMDTVHYVTIIQCTPPVVNKNSSSGIDILGGFG